MNRMPVQSSIIATVGYDASSQTLEVEFGNGAIYQYFDVPETHYSTLVGAASVGSYFTANIRNSYRYSQI